LRGGLAQLGMQGHAPFNTELSELELILLEMISCRRNRMCKGLGQEGIQQTNIARGGNMKTTQSLVRHISELHFY